MEKNTRRILVTAVAALLAVAVVLSALLMPRPGTAPSGTGGAPLSAMALAEPVYPDFPKLPIFDENGTDWQKYNDQLSVYFDALFSLRGEDALDPDLCKALNAFAQHSTAATLTSVKGENALYSPLSLWSALAMLARCAEGESRSQILDALGADSVEQVDRQVAELWRKLYTDDGMSSLIFANSIWLNSSMEGTYVQETVDALAREHYAASYAVPMGTEAADRAVSDWIAQQTRGLIGSDGPVTRTKAETLALLVSSLYYKAAWFDKFHAAANTTDTFTNADGSTTQMEFMHQTQNASYIQAEDYRAAWLPTQLGSMAFVLPEEGVTPEELLAREGFLDRLDSRYDHGVNIPYGRVEWSVPKFDVDSRLDLMDTLTAMGVTHVTDPNKADLSAITTLPAVVSKAEQLARVTVDEEGVEAAAVTIITADATGAFSPPDNVCIMDLDRPFLFVLRYEGLPLFVGVVNQL